MVNGGTVFTLRSFAVTIIFARQKNTENTETKKLFYSPITGIF